MRCTAGIVILSSLCGACAADVPVTARYAERDSAGIRIIENTAPMLPEGSWIVGAAPLVEIGADESNEDQVLFRVAGAVRLDDGRLVIAGSGDPMLRWFDADGQLTHATGRPGGGPGEFGTGEGAWIYDLWRVPGDSIATWEHSARRMQVFDPSGNYVRAVQLELPPDMPPLAYPQVVGRTDSGFIAMLYPVTPRDAPAYQIRRQAFTFMHYGPYGAFRSVIMEPRDFVMFVQEIQGPGGRTFRGDARPLFAPTPSWDARGDRFAYGSGDRFEIELRDASGMLRRLVRRPEDDRTLTTAVVKEHIDARIARIEDPVRQRTARTELEAAPVAERLPAHSRILLDDLGHTWVRNHTAPSDTTRRWSVFDPDGRWLTDILLPNWNIMEIGADRLVVLGEGEYGEEIIRVHRLERGGVGR